MLNDFFSFTFFCYNIIFFPLFSLHTTTIFDVPCRQTTIFLKPLFIASNLIYDTCVLFSSSFSFPSFCFFFYNGVAIYLCAFIILFFFLSIQEQNLTNKLLNWLTYDNLSCAFFTTLSWCIYFFNNEQRINIKNNSKMDKYCTCCNNKIWYEQLIDL